MEQLLYDLLIEHKTNYTVAVYRVFGILQLVFCTSYEVLVQTIFDKFNDWGGRGCNTFVPVVEGNRTKIDPTGDIFDQSPGQMR